ncbi:MAG: TonB-dependent receptor, partial [bacterium]
MKTKIVYIILLIIQSQILTAQDVFIVSGHVFDKNNGEYLVGATIYDQLNSNGTTTNEYGFFSISIPTGRCSIKCSFIGYTAKEISMQIDKDSMLNIGLESKSIDLDEVFVTESTNSNLKNNEFTVERISTKDIRQLPSVIGEPDLIKTLQLQSGVKTIGDGSSGMFIRGGSSDQNLIIIDEAPIYNPSHLFGLISVFNTDVLSDIKFYKSNMPAQYGGRASAVIDCKMKEGNLKQTQLTAGISPFSANVSINGPVIKEKSSYLFSLRKSYLDIFLNTGANLALLPAFYDLNAKVNTKLGERNRLYFSVYNGLDKLRSIDGFYNKWGNKTTSLRWNSILNAKLFSNIS